MLGFGAIGVNPVATGPRGTGVVAQAMLGTIGSRAYLKVQASNSTAISAAIKAAAKGSVQSSNSTAMLGRAKASVTLRAPGGVAIKSIVATMARAKVSPGYLLFAKAAMASSGLSDIHMEGTTSGPRDPLLLNSGSEFIASYWKGRS